MEQLHLRVSRYTLTLRSVASLLPNSVATISLLLSARRGRDSQLSHGLRLRCPLDPTPYSVKQVQCGILAFLRTGKQGSDSLWLETQEPLKMGTMCSGSRLECQNASLHLFHAPPGGVHAFSLEHTSVALYHHQARPQEIWRVTCQWAIPPVQLGLFGRNSGKIPERPRNALGAVPGIPLKSTAGTPQALQFKALSLSKTGNSSFLQKGFRRGPLSTEGTRQPEFIAKSILKTFLM